MLVCGSSLTVCAKVSIVADSALESITTDVILATLDSAQWTVAIDAKVSLRTWARESEGLVKRSETVAWMNLCGTEVASGAVVPIRAVQALVAYTNNCLRRYQHSARNLVRNSTHLITTIA